MGEVFLARQTGVAVDRLVILKSLLPELAEQEGFIDQFLDEARVAATLNHPNIVAIYEVGLWNGVYFIAMEYIHGCDLSRLQKSAAKKRLVLPFQVSARMIHDSCLGLDHAHFAKDMQGNSLNIVHRDISPQNIMVRLDGVAKVVDFGIAKASNRSTRTATGMLKGKLQYMPPEQVQGAELDGRSDQFALGVCLWEMCTGQRLFKAENDIQTLTKILKDPVPQPSSIISGFPPDLEAVIMRMLQRNPAHRYPRLNDAARDLKSYLESSSRVAGEQEVAEFVQKAVGDDLEKNTQNLTPTQENFLLNLGPGGTESRTGFETNTPATQQSMVTQMQQQRSNMALALGVVGALFMVAVVGLGIALLSEDEEQPLPVATMPGNEVAEAPWKPNKRVPKAGEGFFEFEEPVGGSVYLNGKLWKQKIPTVIKTVDMKVGENSFVYEVDDEKFKPQKVTVAPPTLNVKTTPEGCGLIIDGAPIGTAPRTLDTLPPGKHTVVASKQGYTSVTKEVELKPELSFTLDLKLDKRKFVPRPRPGTPSTPGGSTKPPPAVKKVVEYGFVTVNTKPWAKIFIDGQPFGSTPIFKKKLKAGKHRVRLVNESMGIDVKKTLVVKGNKTVKRIWKLK